MCNNPISVVFLLAATQETTPSRTVQSTRDQAEKQPEQKDAHRKPPLPNR